jgi:hypothetical protein
VPDPAVIALAEHPVAALDSCRELAAGQDPHDPLHSLIMAIGDSGHTSGGS